MATDTKDRILDSAELLFAQQGIASTSLRAITDHADVNLASVNYHFQSKDALVQAVLNRRLNPINQ
jgi:AcrR family transcriptional regulator